MEGGGVCRLVSVIGGTVMKKEMGHVERNRVKR